MKTRRKSTMADAKKMIPFIKKWEGGYSNHPNDTGGCTMMGVTLATYQKYFGKEKTCEDLKNITEDEWLHIFKKGYWDKMKADKIENQTLAQLCVDMCWGSGPTTAIKKIQKRIGADVDGIVGPQTLGILNSKPRYYFNLLWVMRYNWFLDIVKAKPQNKVFLRGWLNRLNDIKFRP